VFYEKAKQAYMKIFERLGLGSITYLTFASGGSFSKFSHEFQTVTEVGEDTIYVHEAKHIAVNKGVYTDEVLANLGITKADLVEKRAVEVGNIFTLGTRFSQPLDLVFSDEDGSTKPVIMGSYGIGPGRVMGTIVEHFADDKGIVWPTAIAPARVYLVSVGTTTAVIEVEEKLYNILTAAGVEVIYDDRDVRPGSKFADADLIGVPYRVVVSDKTLASDQYEVKARTEAEVQFLNADGLIKLMAS
jgi:prolyl-tRNA synthetase